MSTTSAREGTLMVNPLLGRATAYFLLRPFFQANKNPSDIGSAFLDPSNWRLEERTSSVLQGAVPSNCQELNEMLHPHLGLESTMVHVLEIEPGDYVAWHCDSEWQILSSFQGLQDQNLTQIAIHAVDKIHAGTKDSSVMYIPACPLTEANAEYLKRQRESFFEGLIPGSGSELC